MKYIVAITFFLLGIVTYIYFPRDAHIEVPDNAPRVLSGTQIIHNENQCATYQDYLLVDKKMITGQQHIQCQK